MWHIGVGTMGMGVEVELVEIIHYEGLLVLYCFVCWYENGT